MSVYLYSIDWMQVIHTNPSASGMWTEFLKLLQYAIDACVPSFAVPVKCKLSTKPRQSRPVRKLDAKKRRIWKCLSKTPHDFFLRQKYKDCADEWRQAVRQNEILVEERVVAANNLSAFYNYVYKRTTNHCGIGVVIDKSGSPITNDHEKANAFNNHFSSVGVVDNYVVPPCSDVPLCCILENINISANDVIQSINKLKTNFSCGPDGLPPVLFKRLKHSLVSPWPKSITNLSLSAWFLIADVLHT